MQRAVVIDGFNEKDPESSLKLVMKPIPKAEPGQVVVHLTLRPVNPTDLVAIRSGRAARGIVGSATPGSEGFGIVHEVGEGVTKVQPGQRVVPFFTEAGKKGEGSWQQYVSVREDLVWPVPDTISDETAAQFVINPWTVYGMLTDLQVPKGEYVLQTAAGSVLGRQVIQLAKHWGIKTINVVRRAEQKEELLGLGADEVICSTEEDIVARVKAITGRKGAWGGLDCVGGEMTKKVCASVRWGGQVLVYGVLSSVDATVAITDLFRGVHVTGWILYNFSPDPAKRQEYIENVAKLLEEKVIVPLEGEKFDLADFKAAMNKTEEVGRGGKVLLTS
uniref:Enoyl reductase (ER) domain-containing protein n=1 Tax=Physcomitrium patens TaxID=3218 RepID=A9T5D5_PHYPA|nr:hypothetical protein PHYPA_026188 [Physcomitrium patens]